MKLRLIFPSLDVEQVEQLVLPLADQRLRDDQQDALRAFGPALGDHQARLDRLAQSDFVGEDAAAFAEPAQREDHRVDLVRVGIDPRLALRGRVAFPVIGTADADELFGEDAPVERVKRRARWSLCHVDAVSLSAPNQHREGTARPPFGDEPGSPGRQQTERARRTAQPSF